jgi:hypothetical protein
LVRGAGFRGHEWSYRHADTTIRGTLVQIGVEFKVKDTRIIKEPGHPPTLVLDLTGWVEFEPFLFGRFVPFGASTHQMFLIPLDSDRRWQFSLMQSIETALSTITGLPIGMIHKK